MASIQRIRLAFAAQYAYAPARVLVDRPFFPESLLGSTQNLLENGVRDPAGRFAAVNCRVAPTATPAKGGAMLSAFRVPNVETPPLRRLL